MPRSLSSVSTCKPSLVIAVNPTQNINYITHGDNTLTYIDGWTNTVHQVERSWRSKHERCFRNGHLLERRVCRQQSFQ
jgi:hypothetical protein